MDKALSSEVDEFILNLLKEFGTFIKIREQNEEKLLLSAEEVAKILGLSRSMIYKLRTSDPDFPEPVSIGTAQKWRINDLKAWIASLR